METERRRFELYFCAANVAAGLWGYFYPRPYDACLAVLISLPWLSILAARLLGGTSALAYTILGPVTALVARAVSDLDLPAVGRLTAFACGTGALFAGAAFVSDRTAWRWYGLALLVVGLFYGFGAAAEVDVLLDASAARHFAAPILSRDYYIGRHSTFNVVLGPWGDRLRPNKNSVSWNVYLALRGESTACIDIGPGALGMEWSMISMCGDIASKR
jgi:hypothetical protein